MDPTLWIYPQAVHFAQQEPLTPTFTQHISLALHCAGLAGFQAYLVGNWKDAKAIFEETKSLRRSDQGTTTIDGPSNTLLEVMKQHSFNAPKNWAGFRELTEK